jgi:hypothetical protein
MSRESFTPEERAFKETLFKNQLNAKPEGKATKRESLSDAMSDLLSENKLAMADYAAGRISKRDIRKMAAHAHRAMEDLHGKEREEAENIWKTWTAMMQ